MSYWIFPRQTRCYTFSFPLTRWLAQRSDRYDVIHLHALFSYPAVVAAACARRAAIPFVVRPLGTLNRWGMAQRRPWFKKLSFRWIESGMLRRAAAVHYTSEQEAWEASLLGVEHRAAVIPNPVNLPAAVPASGEFRVKHRLQDKLLALFLSRLDPKKGLDLLLPAFAVLHSQQPRAALAIAGHGEASFVAGLKERAASLGLAQSIVWAGFLEGKEKQAALADADLFVLPSYSENFGVAVVEAMGAGVPVILSDQVGIHREVSQAGAGLVVECGVDSLSDALRRAMADAEWRRRAGANGIQAARQFAPPAVAAQLESLYKRIRAQHDRPIAA